MKSTSMILPLAGLLATGLFASAAGNMQAPATAQITAKQYFACYVPATGTVYLIKQPGLRSECASGHVQFSWSDGASNPAVTPAVVVTDPDGWAATGTFGSGVIPVTGAGVRLKRLGSIPASLSASSAWISGVAPRAKPLTGARVRGISSGGRASAAPALPSFSAALRWPDSLPRSLVAPWATVPPVVSLSSVTSTRE